MPPASVCSTLRCVRFKSHTSLFSQHVKDSATTAGLAPCERVFHTRGCELQRTHLSVLAARQRSRHDGRACPLRAWVPRSGVSTSAPSHLDSPSASEDRTTTAGLAPCERMFHAQVCARQHLLTVHFVARPKTAPRRQGLPLRASPAHVCAHQRFCLAGHICGQRPIADAGYPSSPCIDP